MPLNSNRWQRLAAELADERDRPARTGRKWRAKLRAQREAETAGQDGSETHSPHQEPPDGKPGNER